MSQATTAQLIADYFAATRQLDGAAWLATFAPDAVSYDPVGGTPLVGHEAIGKFFENITSLFTSVGLTEEFVHIVGNEVAVKFIGAGTGKNGKHVTFEGIDIFEINPEGKIQTLRAYWDPAAVIAELS